MIEDTRRVSIVGLEQRKQDVVKSYFLTALLVMVPVAICLWFLYSLGTTLLGMFQDWRLGRELNELQSQGEARRQQLQEANRMRLDNGCGHDFETGAHGLPANACRHCGLEREKPPGACDHLWKVTAGPVPCSACQKCGKTYSATQADAGLGVGGLGYQDSQRSA